MAWLLILSIFLASDTIEVKGTNGISYRALVNQDTLYFQYKINLKWSEPMVIDNGDVASPSMAISSGNYLHVVWCKQGKVYYQTTLEPITKYSMKRKLNPQWSWKMAISTVNPYTEPASNPIVQLYDDKVFVTWQCFNGELVDGGEVWVRWRDIANPMNLWTETENQSSQRRVYDFQNSLKQLPSYFDSIVVLKRIVFLNPGEHYTTGYILCGDTDNDGLNELIFNNNTTYTSLQIWEYRSTNRYELVWMAIGGQPPPPGRILTGNFRPYDIGDVDKDSLKDRLGGIQSIIIMIIFILSFRLKRVLIPLLIQNHYHGIKDILQMAQKLHHFIIPVT